MTREPLPSSGSRRPWTIETLPFLDQPLDRRALDGAGGGARILRGKERRLGLADVEEGRIEPPVDPQDASRKQRIGDGGPDEIDDLDIQQPPSVHERRRHGESTRLENEPAAHDGRQPRPRRTARVSYRGRPTTFE